MNAEDASSVMSSSDVNPFWAEAEARLRDAGVVSSKPEQVAETYAYQTPQIYPFYGASPYASVAMPSVAESAYNWPTMQPYPVVPPPPPPRPVHHFQRPQRIDSTRVPFSYTNQQPRPQHQRFSMSITRPQNGNRFIASNPVVVDDTLGDPKSGFFLRGRHPPSLKIYVSRALAHPTTSDEKTRCENYLYSKIEPLLLSGAVFHVRWESEPLPHEKNYELSSWTPAAKFKSSNSSPVKREKDNRKHDSAFSRFSGPDIPLVAPPRKSFSSTSPTPIIQRGVKKSKKRKNNFGSRFDDDDFDLKRLKGEKIGKKSSHTENWLEDWIDSRKRKTRLSTSVQVMSLNQWQTRRKAICPPNDGSRLARSFPKILNSLGQGLVDEYFNRNEGRFDPNDCYEVVGTCYEIEKKFFRLTKKPEASEIRPPTVLKKAYSRLQEVARDPSKYKYVCDQLRSIRQDLTVQKIRNEFTVAVYEFHARLTLENKDLCEFNQCQSQLRHLYNDIPGCKNEYEFTAYRLLYYILTEDDQDILSLLNDLDSKARKSPSISLAIKVHDAFLKGHHIRLFKLYHDTPRMCGHVMDLFLDRERRRFIKIVRASYHPNIEVSVLSNWFQFSSEKEFATYMKAERIEVVPGSKTEPKKWPSKA